MTKEKAIKKFVIGNMAESAAIRVCSKVSVLKAFVLRVVCVKLHCCVSCALHRTVVSNQSCEAQKEQKLRSLFSPAVAAPQPLPKPT